MSAGSHSYYTDPAGIRVVELIDSTYAYPKNGCANGSGAGTYGHMFTPTQWYADPLAPTQTFDCSEVYAHASQAFHNAYFCNLLTEAFPITAAFTGGYGVTNVTIEDDASAINSNGTYTTFWNETENGPCSNLLTPHHKSVSPIFEYEQGVAAQDGNGNT